MKKSHLIVCILLLLSLKIQAQSEADSLKKDLVIIARSYGDSIVLRWAPTSYHVWNLGNKYGYVLTRWKPNSNGFENIAGPILPYTLQEWKTKTDTTDVTVTIAAQVLHGKTAVDPTASNAMGRKLMAHEEQNNRYAFALMAADFSAPVAQALALRYCDKDLKESKGFIYKLYIPYAEEKLDTAMIYVNTSKIYQPYPVMEVSAEGKDLAIEISWNRPLNDQRFSGYYIEKSPDGKKFKRLNERPFRSDESVADGLLHIYKDSVEQNGRDYWYRVIGLTSFGDEELPSEIVKVRAEDKTPPVPPFIITSEETADHQVLITWKTNAHEPDHNGFYVMKSQDVNIDFETISEKLNKSTRTFTDPSPSSFRPNYYKVVAVDENGNTSQSITTMTLLKDDTPPAKPLGLIGEVDSLGIVSLAWDLGSEEDLKGYRVYRSNGENREFIQITTGPIPGNFFTDTVSLRTLTKKVYYKIAAFDFNYNPSKYSEILELVRPDYFPPVKPVMRQVMVVADTIKLRWVPSTSDDVARHILFRRNLNQDEEWQILAMIDDSTHTYSDTDVLFDQRYQYAIEAVDAGGLRSGKSGETTVLFKMTSPKQTVTNLSGQFDPDHKNFQLSWEYNASGHYKFQIFKGETGKDLNIYATVAGNERNFEDNAFYVNESGYEYAVKVLHSDGRESFLSEPVKVVFREGQK